MLNGITGAAAACCQYSPNKDGAGLRPGAGNVGAGIQIAGNVYGGGNKPGIIQRIEDAINQAIHGGDSITSVATRGSSFPLNGGQEIDFPMVNPFKPVGDAKVPASGFTAFPATRLRLVRGADVSHAGGVSRKAFNNRGNEDIGPPANDGDGNESLGFTYPGSGISLPDTHPSKLETIVAGISATLPATIAAARANPGNIYPGVYGPYGSNAGGAYPGGTVGTDGTVSDIGARAGSAVGGLGDTVGGIVRDHPYAVLAAGAAALLLFMNPPRRRR